MAETDELSPENKRLVDDVVEHVEDMLYGNVDAPEGTSVDEDEEAFDEAVSRQSDLAVEAFIAGFTGREVSQVRRWLAEPIDGPGDVLGSYA